MKRLLFSLYLAVFAAAALSASDMRVVINSGHTGPVRSLDVDERNNLLFSGGDDGTVRAWDTDTKKLVSLLQISHYPVLKIVLHPVKPHVAAVQKNGINSYLLTVWNWKTKTELYSRDLEELPLCIEYSPKGSYLIYSKTSWDSLTVLRGETGRKLPYLSRGFGIVSHFAVSPSENTIITYSPSGRLYYYDIREGERKYSFTTLPDLEKIEFTGNLRFMAASDTERFLFIDLTSGTVINEFRMKNITTISSNSLTGDFMCLYPSENNYQVSTVNVSSGEMNERKIGTTNDIIPGTGIFHINTLYIPKERGDIAFFTSMAESEEKTIDRNILAPVTNLSFSQNRMAFTAGNGIFLIDSEFFSGGRFYSTPANFEVSRYDTSYTPPLSVTALNNSGFLIWQQQPGVLSYFFPDNSEEERKAEFASDLLQVTVYDDGILTLESSGTCSLLDPETLQKNFSYPGFGIKTAALAEDNIFLGKSRASGFNASILNVNRITGETVPVFDSSILIYEVKYHEGEKKFYTLAVEQDAGSTRTVLKSFQYPSFGGGMELLSYPGEDLTAQIAIGPESATVYTSLGFDGITEVTRRNTSNYRQYENIPRSIFLHNNFLYTINTDHSITVWEKGEKRRIMNFYMFRDYEWIALLADGEYYSSSGAGKYIGVYDGIKRLPDYRARSLRLN
jgi:WD40 repeat protein